MPASKSRQSRASKSSIPRQLRLKGATQGDGPSYAGQTIFRVTLPANINMLTTTVTTGVASYVQVLNNSVVAAFSTRFGSTFDEYRILGVDVDIRPIAASTGLTAFWFDEKSSTAPAYQEVGERVALRLPNSSASDKSYRTMRWRARDLLDLQYTAIGSSSTPVYLKAYTDTANYGAPTAVTNLFYLEARLHFELRGLKSA